MRSRTLVLPIVIVFAGFSAACGPRDTAETDTAEEQTPAATPDAMTPPAETSRTLSFEPGTVAGTAIVTEKTDGATEVSVDLNGLAPGDHAWHIHQGACGTDGPIVVAFTSTPDMPGTAQPLNADDSGHATGDVTVESTQLTADQLKSGQYSIHVHEGSGESPGAGVACVTLR